MALMMKSSTVGSVGKRAAAPKAAVASRAVSRRCAVVVRAHNKPLVGAVAPDFKAQAVFDQEFVEVQLSKYRGKYVVLFFYPLGV